MVSIASLLALVSVFGMVMIMVRVEINERPTACCDDARATDRRGAGR